MEQLIGKQGTLTLFFCVVKPLYEQFFDWNCCVDIGSEGKIWKSVQNSFFAEKMKINLKKKTLWPLFMDGFQLPQGHSHFEEAVYFLQFSSQKFLVLILLSSEGWKAESTLEPPSSLEHGTAGLGIQHLNN